MSDQPQTTGDQVPTNEGEAVASLDGGNYGHLSRDALEARLKVAEDVCVLVGWCAHHESERGDALTQLWMTWLDMSGVDTSPEAHPDLDAMVPTLARQRREQRQRTLEHFFGDKAVDDG